MSRNTLQAAPAIGVARTTLREWIDKFDWKTRADRRDLEMQRAAERAAVKRRENIIARQAKTADSLLARGVEFLQQNKITRASDAIKACQIGVEMARQAEGFPDWMVQIQSMSEDELEAELARQLRFARLEGTGDPAGAFPETGDDAEDDGEAE